MKEPDFRCYHLLRDEQAKQISAMTDDVAERAHRSAELRFTPSAICRIISAQEQESRIRCAE
jgi:DNA-binding ferritin-like protein